MNTKIKSKFGNMNIPGLYIYWEDFEEMEHIPITNFEYTGQLKSFAKCGNYKYQYVTEIRNVNGKPNIVYKKELNKSRDMIPGYTEVLLSNSVPENLFWFDKTNNNGSEIQPDHWHWQPNIIPSSLFDNSRKSNRITVEARENHQIYKELLFNEYGHCVISNCKHKEVLDFAHIVPYSEKGINSTHNGVLLRTDIHRLFDLDLIQISETGNVNISPEYSDYLPSYNKVIDENILLKIKLALKLRNKNDMA